MRDGKRRLTWEEELEVINKRSKGNKELQLHNDKAVIRDPILTAENRAIVQLLRDKMAVYHLTLRQLIKRETALLRHYDHQEWHMKERFRALASTSRT